MIRGPVLRSLADARAYMLKLPIGIQERGAWQHAANVRAVLPASRQPVPKVPRTEFCAAGECCGNADKHQEHGKEKSAHGRWLSVPARLMARVIER